MNRKSFLKTLLAVPFLGYLGLTNGFCAENDGWVYFKWKYGQNCETCKLKTNDSSFILKEREDIELISKEEYENYLFEEGEVMTGHKKPCLYSKGPNRTIAYFAVVFGSSDI